MKRRLIRPVSKNVWSFPRAWKETNEGDRILVWRADDPDHKWESIAAEKKDDGVLKRLCGMHTYNGRWRWEIIERKSPTPLDKDSE